MKRKGTSSTRPAKPLRMCLLQRLRDAFFTLKDFFRSLLKVKHSAQKNSLTSGRGVLSVIADNVSYATIGLQHRHCSRAAY